MPLFRNLYVIADVPVYQHKQTLLRQIINNNKKGVKVTDRATIRDPRSECSLTLPLRFFS